MTVLHGFKIYYLPKKNYYLGVNCQLLVQSFCGCQIIAEPLLINKMLCSMFSPDQMDMCFPFKHFIAPTENKSAMSLGSWGERAGIYSWTSLRKTLPYWMKYVCTKDVLKVLLVFPNLISSSLKRQEIQKSPSVLAYLCPSMRSNRQTLLWFRYASGVVTVSR